MNILLNWIRPNCNFWINFWIEFSGKRGCWNFFELNIPQKLILNNPLNWILSWNEWMNHILNRYLPFLMKSPLFCLIWTLFGQFFGTFPIWPVSMIPWLLNWIIFWIESPEFIWTEKYFELNLGQSNIESNIELIIFWQNSNIELNQIGYR